jgi:hypothetical protein
LEHQRLNKLVYVSYNRKMENRFKKIRELGSRGKTSNPLLLEEFHWENEWVDESCEQVHEGSGNDITWLQVDEALGATQDLQGRMPRGAAAIPRRAAAMSRGTAGTSRGPAGMSMDSRGTVGMSRGAAAAPNSIVAAPVTVNHYARKRLKRTQTVIQDIQEEDDDEHQEQEATSMEDDDVSAHGDGDGDRDGVRDGDEDKDEDGDGDGDGDGEFHLNNDLLLD